MKLQVAVMVASLAMCASGLAAADEVQDGQNVVKAKCLGCHNQDKIITLAKRKPEAERAAHWDKFLPLHNAPDVKERKAIIAYLLQAAK